MAGILILFILLIILLLFSGKKSPQSRTAFMLDTVCTVTLYEWQGDSDEILNDTLEVCRQYEKLLSTTVSGSDIDRINHSNGQPVAVSKTTADLLIDAGTYTDLSGGAFDITIYPVKQLWHFGTNEERVPDQKELEAALTLIDVRQMQIDSGTVTLPEGMGVDLGAVAKGFIADEMGRCLREHGVTSAIVDLGGNILTVGSRPDGKPWRVGIRRPFGDDNIAVQEVSDASVVTSGVYQRFFEQDHVIYHHLLDARSGKPCDTGLYSVTVIGASSQQCDALATVCMLLGYEKSVSLLRNYPDLEAVFVTSEGEVRYFG